MDKTLRRLDDDFRIHGHIQFVEFDTETSKGKILQETIIVGGAAIIDWEDGKGCIWQTSNIVEKISETEFKTKNSHYVIEVIDSDLLNKLNNEVKLRSSFSKARSVMNYLNNDNQ